MIVDETNIKQIVQSHGENIKSNQHRIDDLYNQFNKINTKLWWLLVLLAGVLGRDLVTTLIKIGA